jgi:beta-glucosidase
LRSAALVADALGDRVKHWVLLNEPKTFTSCGYWYGIHAPGRRDPKAFVRATHTANLAQGMAFRAMKAVSGRLQIGSAFDVAPMYPFTQSAADIAAAERWHKFQNYGLCIPRCMAFIPSAAGRPTSEWLACAWRRTVAARAARFVGLNYYTPVLVGDALQGNGIPPQHGEYLGHDARRLPRPISLGYSSAGLHGSSCARRAS